MIKVLGHGAIAKRFANYNLQTKYIIFTGGLHNVIVQDIDDISNEEYLLKSALTTLTKSETLIYFSSCTINDSTQESSPFIIHKIWAEQLIQSTVKNYLIIRLPEVLGLMNIEEGYINTLVSKFRAGDKIRLFDAPINFIDLDHVYAIVNYILQKGDFKNAIVNVASPNAIPALELMDVLEEHFDKLGDYEISPCSHAEEIDINSIRNTIDELGIDFGPNYLKRGLKKYFGYFLNPAPLLSIIVPTYNQSLGINEFYRRTKVVLKNLEPRFRHELIFVNDHSLDDTWQKLQQLAESDDSVKAINFSRNFGNQMGITAGVTYCRGDLAVIIDDDLQDPPEIIFDFIAKWYDGYQVVYGVRPVRRGVPLFFRIFAKIYYRVIHALSDTSIPQDTGDFRLIDKLVLNELRKMKEENRYYRGMVSWIGFKQTGYIYQRDSRYAGKSNFSFSGYLNFALNGLTSFTDKPLYFSCAIGFAITIISFMLLVYLILYKLINPEWSIRGWTSIMVLVIFFGGVQLFSLGIAGIYISKIYREVKARPLFIVREFINLENHSHD